MDIQRLKQRASNLWHRYYQAGFVADIAALDDVKTNPAWAGFVLDSDVEVTKLAYLSL